MTITKGHTFSDGDTLTATKLNNLVDNAGDGAATFNDAGAAVDFRIEGDTDTHLFFVDGSADRISIGVSVDPPAAVLEVTGDAATAAPVLQVNNLEDTINGVEIVSDSLTSGSALSVKSDSSSTTARSIAHIHQDHADASAASALKITQDNAAAASIDLTAQDSIIQLKDDSASALSFDAAGKTGILKFVTTDDSEKITMSGDLEVTGAFTSTAATNVYSTGWATSHGGEPVANGATMVVTHNLDTTDVEVRVYVNSSASDTGAQQQTIQHLAGSTVGYGARATSLAANTCTIQLGSGGWFEVSSTGTISPVTYASTYVKVVVIG